MNDARTPPGELRRALGTSGATVLGLSSILGTGIFVSLGLGAGLAGSALPFAIGLAALLALANGFSSAQLAAAFPVSGGTYEYGRRLLHPAAGLLAGWLFLAAKSFSAAAAAIGFGAYLGALLGIDSEVFRRAIGVVAVGAVSTVALAGIRPSFAASAVLLAVGIGGLLVFCFAALQLDREAPAASLGTPRDIARAAALAFVAFTGYGRIATLGEEAHDPRRTIPRAITFAVVATAALSLLVCFAALALVSPRQWYALTSSELPPLGVLAQHAGLGTIARIVEVAAVCALAGVLLNLVLGLSRVVFAMGRNRHLPSRLAHVNERRRTPDLTTVLVAMTVAVLAATIRLERAWTLSAATVLLYYFLTNLAALRLPAEMRFLPRAASWIGLAGCLALAAATFLP
ncbi:MAG: APC family permease [Planctomycetota bacterium]